MEFVSKNGQKCIFEWAVRRKVPILYFRISFKIILKSPVVVTVTVF